MNEHADPPGQQDDVQPLAVDTVAIIYGGIAAFGLALVVIMLVPSLHAGQRDWWPWVCVSGLALGLIGLVYILRGRGNAAGARHQD